MWSRCGVRSNSVGRQPAPRTAVVTSGLEAQVSDVDLAGSSHHPRNSAHPFRVIELPGHAFGACAAGPDLEPLHPQGPEVMVTFCTAEVRAPGSTEPSPSSTAPRVEFERCGRSGCARGCRRIGAWACSQQVLSPRRHRGGTPGTGSGDGTVPRHRTATPVADLRSSRRSDRPGGRSRTSRPWRSLPPAPSAPSPGVGSHRRAAR
jgi:hypothetical protein